MNITFAPRGILQIDDARITYKNFRGEASQFNRQGDRNFSLIIDDPALAEQLIGLGWNVKVKPARDEDEIPFMHLPVKVKFNERGPIVYLESGNNPPVRLSEDEVGILDNMDIAGIDLDIRPFDWEVNGRTGRTAYLQSIRVVQNVDRFAARYELRSTTSGVHDFAIEEAMK